MGTEGDKRRAILLCVCIACILIGLSFFVLDPLSLRQEKEKPSLPVSQAERGKNRKNPCLCGRGCEESGSL